MWHGAYVAVPLAAIDVLRASKPAAAAAATSLQLEQQQSCSAKIAGIAAELCTVSHTCRRPAGSDRQRTTVVPPQCAHA
jgi:hypothetical protein